MRSPRWCRDLCAAGASWLALVSGGLAQEAASTPASKVSASAKKASVSVLARTDGMFATFPGLPATEQHGKVIFKGRRRDTREGIYASSGGALDIIAETGMRFQDELGEYTVTAVGDAPRISVRMVSLFRASFAGSGTALMLRTSATAPLEFLVDSSDSLREFGERFAINRQGDVLFTASVDPRGHPERLVQDEEVLERVGYRPEDIPAPERLTAQGLRRDFHRGLFFDGNDGEAEVIAGTDREHAEVDDGVALNDQRMVAFLAMDSLRRWSLYLSLQEGQRIVVASTGPFFRRLGPPCLDARGQVYFYAETPDGQARICRGAWGSGQPEVLFAADASYKGFDADLAISSFGDLAVVAHGPKGQRRLLVRSIKGEVEELLASGDTIPGGVVQSLRIGPAAFAGPRRVAAHVTLQPPGEAIVMLTRPGR